MNTKQLFNFGKRGFSAALYNYSNAANPRVFLTVANGDKKLGDLVFELYADRQPQTAESFSSFCQSGEGSYVGTSFHHGMSGFGISGGKLGEENSGAFGLRLQDEDLTVRHVKRGMLTLPNDG